ncbi:MAG: hypothetical protein KA383_18765 [Phycisphaerae bacterium]|jgi:hypothetical protein|nr:hypothetical protein [Phycisphaerae bacterium]
MRKWKWIALTLAGGTLLQLSACASDLGYYVLQLVATQIVSALVNSATTGA